MPGRVPGTRRMLARVLRDARLVVAAGGYPAAEARRAAGRDLPTVVVPPGVDLERFHPLTDAERRAERGRLGLDPDAPLVLGLSRLVPRKGFDVLIEAGAALAARHPDLQIAIAGAGRDRKRLERMATHLGSPVRFLGRLPEADLPVAHGVADCFAMLCRDRWGGLEQEGFGIVFLEAAACAVPSVAGRSGGSAEAVLDGATGIVVDGSKDVVAVAAALDRLLSDEQLRQRLGATARRRAVDGVRLRRAGPTVAGGPRRARNVVVSEPDDQLSDQSSDDDLGALDDGPEAPEAPEVPEGGYPGRGIVRASLVGTALFTVLGVLGAVWPDVFGPPFLVVSLVEFLVGTVVFVLAFLRAVDRSRTEAIGIGGLFFAAGSTPARVQRALIGSLVVQTVVAIVVGSVRLYSIMAFGILAPMWALGFTGLWVAAYGTFPEREPELTRAAMRDADRRAHKAGGSADRRGRTE